MGRRFYSPLGSNAFPINTIIGGVAASISTKALLATKLGIAESEIRRFEIVGSDVQVNIRSKYTIPTSAFDGDLTIKSFLDLEGKVLANNSNSFRSSGILTAQFPQVTILQGFAGSLVSNIIGDEFQSIAPAGISGTKTQTVNLSKVHTVSASGVRDTNLEEMNFLVLTTLSNQAVRNNTLLKRFIAPILETASSESQFLGCTALELIQCRKLKVFGDPSIISNAFTTSTKAGFTIEVNIALKTANAGNAHAALVYAKGTKSAIVNFYNDDGTYNSTL